MGQEGAWTSDVYFTDVHIGPDALIGGSGTSVYRAALTSLARGRIHIAALAVGAAQQLDESVGFAASATQGGAAVRTFQLVQAMLADQQTRVLAGRALVRDAARLWLSGEDRPDRAVGKLFCTEMAGKVADLAVQIHGRTGYMRGVPVDASTAIFGCFGCMRGRAGSAADHRRGFGEGRSRLSAGGQGRDRTGDLPLFRRTLVPTRLPGPEGPGRFKRCLADVATPDGTQTRDLPP